MRGYISIPSKALSQVIPCRLSAHSFESHQPHCQAHEPAPWRAVGTRLAPGRAGYYPALPRSRRREPPKSCLSLTSCGTSGHVCHLRASFSSSVSWRSQHPPPSYFVVWHTQLLCKWSLLVFSPYSQQQHLTRSGQSTLCTW